MLPMEEFEKIVFSSYNMRDQKIENLKKTIFSNFSNNADFYSLDYKNNFHTENKQEYDKKTKISQPQFSNLLLEYKLGEFEKKNEKCVILEDFKKKLPIQKLGKKPDFVQDLQKPSFYMFSRFENN